MLLVPRGRLITCTWVVSPRRSPVRQCLPQEALPVRWCFLQEDHQYCGKFFFLLMSGKILSLTRLHSVGAAGALHSVICRTGWRCKMSTKAYKRPAIQGAAIFCTRPQHHRRSQTPTQSTPPKPATNPLPDDAATGVGCTGKLSKLGHLEEPAYPGVVSHWTNRIKGKELGGWRV